MVYLFWIDLQRMLNNLFMRRSIGCVRVQVQRQRANVYLVH